MNSKSFIQYPWAIWPSNAADRLHINWGFIVNVLWLWFIVGLPGYVASGLDSSILLSHSSHRKTCSPVDSSKTVFARIMWHWVWNINLFSPKQEALISRPCRGVIWPPRSPPKSWRWKEKVCSQILSLIGHLCTQEVPGTEHFKNVVKERVLWSAGLERILDTFLSAPHLIGWPPEVSGRYMRGL